MNTFLNIYITRQLILSPIFRYILKVFLFRYFLGLGIFLKPTMILCKVNSGFGERGPQSSIFLICCSLYKIISHLKVMLILQEFQKYHMPLLLQKHALRVTTFFVH